jgi:acetyl-CoA acetyltransferase
VFDAIADRNIFDTSAIDDVITGCVSQGGQQTMDLGRNARARIEAARQRSLPSRSTANADRRSRR